jgi:hypothetical protein
MEEGLLQLIVNYQTSWFKSDHRKEKADALHRSVTEAIRTKRADHDITSRYETILKTIHQVRIETMQEDLQDNKSRYFKLNRNGHSRYFIRLYKISSTFLINDTKTSRLYGQIRLSAS